METDGFGALGQSLYFIQKARVSAQVRKKHLEKQDKTCSITEEVLTRMGNVESWLNGEVMHRDCIEKLRIYISSLKKAWNVKRQKKGKINLMGNIF